MPEKGIDAREILLGMGLSSYLYLIWLLPQWDKADDLFLNLPCGAVALFIDKTLAYCPPKTFRGLYHVPSSFEVLCISTVCAIEKRCGEHYAFEQTS